MARGNTTKPATVADVKPRAIATVRHVDDDARLEVLLAIIRRGLDARRDSGRG